MGYRYCEAKETIGSLAAEYLRITKQQVSDRSDLKKMVEELHSQGATPTGIGKRLGIKLRVVKGWLYEGKRYGKTRRQKCELDFAAHQSNQGRRRPLIGDVVGIQFRFELEQFHR